MTKKFVNKRVFVGLLAGVVFVLSAKFNGFITINMLYYNKINL